ncbi:MAG: S41 family peptidase [Bacteroidaceae bacterium]
MKKRHSTLQLFYTILVVISTGLSLTSCGEDRTHEFDELVSPNPWIYNIMIDHYLYYQDIEQPEDADYFSESPDFFTTLLSDQDGKDGSTYSYVQGNTVTKATISDLSYGWELKYIRMNSETTNVAVQVEFVYPSSPAALAGLKRGDIFIKRDGEQYTQSNYTTFATETDAATLTLLDDTTTITLPAATNATYDPLVAHSIIEQNGLKVGYVCYSKFIVDSGDSSDEYINNLINTIGEMASQNIDEFILDLRYNRGGDIVASQKLSTILLPKETLGKELFHLQYNGKQENNTIQYLSDKSFLNGQSNLEISRIYIITSGYTASASELVINSIIPYFGRDNVILVGQTTFGKHVAMAGYTNPDSPEYTYWPVVADVYNSEGTADYDNGFIPDFDLTETTSTTLQDLGSSQEWYVKNILSLIDTGAIIDTDTNTDSSESEGSNPLANQSIYPNPINAKALPIKIGLSKD